MKGKAVVYSKFGHPPDTVEVVELETESPTENQVVVAMEAIAVSLGNLYEIVGLPGFRGTLPAVAGNKCVGRIVEKGSAVIDWEIGQRVQVTLPGVGTWREHVCVAQDVIYPAPDNADPGELSLVSGGVLSAYFMMKDYVDLQPGDWIIQNSGNANVGRYLISLAKMWGFKTVNVVRREEVFPDLESLGADVVLLDGPDLAERVAEATGGARIRLGIDGLAGEATERIARCLATSATVICYGLAGDDAICQLSAQSLLFNDVRLVGYYIARSREIHGKEEMNRIYTEMGELVANGTLSAEIAGRYPLDRIRDALTHALKRGNERKGKIILVP